MFSAVTIFEAEDHLFSYLSGYFATLTVLILFSKYSAITANESAASSWSLFKVNEMLVKLVCAFFMAHVDAVIVLLPEDTVVESGKVI